MTPNEWNRLFDLFHAARETSGDERILLLDTACGESTLVRKAVEELLREDEAADGFLSKPLFGSLQGNSSRGTVASGQRFGRYITIELIGRGGIGEVWSAQDNDLDRLVALKFLSSETITALDPQQITREAKAASALNHPGIVTIHEVVQSGTTWALVMELVEGTPLRSVCGRAIPVSEAMAIGLQIAEALAAAHAGGTIHGLARKITTETIALAASPMLGTMRYMSPEQARGESLTRATDVFSFGLVLYELMTGYHAFAAASALDTAKGILEKDPIAPLSLNHSVPPRLDSLVRRMLSKDPLARPTASEVARTLDEIQSPHDASQKLISRVWKWGSAALLFIVIGYVGWLWRQARDPDAELALRQITTFVPENRATASALSPNGKTAVYANLDGIFLRAIADGDTKLLSKPNNTVVNHLAWSGDGTNLVANGFSPDTYLSSVWMIPTTGETPRLLRTNSREATPSPDGKQIAYISQDWSAIWLMDSRGENAKKIISGPGQDKLTLSDDEIKLSHLYTPE